MSDYTDFTYLDYHNGGEGQRCVDQDAIAHAFSQAGASYYGDGSEFVVGYDSSGGAMIDSDAVRAAARRKAEEAEASRRGGEALLRLLMQQRQAQASTYLYRGRDIIYYMRRGDHILGTQLLHKSGNCPYLFNAAKLGPFMNEMDGVIRTYGSFEGSVTMPCPCCFRMREKEDAEDAAKMDAILAALQSGRWHLECYTLNHPAPRADAAPARAPAQKMTDSYFMDSGRKISSPREHSLRIQDCTVTVEPEWIRCELMVVSPLPIAEDSEVLLPHELSVSYSDGDAEHSVFPDRGERTCGAKPLPWREYRGEGFGQILRLDYRKRDFAAWDFPRKYAPEQFSVSFATMAKMFEDGGYSIRPRTVFPMKGASAPVVIPAKSAAEKAGEAVDNHALPAGCLRLRDVDRIMMDHGTLFLFLVIDSRRRLTTGNREQTVELQGEVEIFRKGFLSKSVVVSWNGPVSILPDGESRNNSDAEFPYRYKAIVFRNDWLLKMPGEGNHQYRIRLTGDAVAGGEISGQAYIHPQ